ncbi:ATP-dependent RNA helicase HrpA [Pseudonocardia halophobica]|uniref:RNA helicase n=1 Tax=Pseudonocardia halophobica TaxID=29401 RepID=A0A9W6L727_9PSEU|nr:ATP-dependent RNA helicase HrpA [Pseudonocardia halophobica]GLL14882.1 ATP-dependent helicase [Pseudonocardia halophobica]
MTSIRATGNTAARAGDPSARTGVPLPSGPPPTTATGPAAPQAAAAPQNGSAAAPESGDRTRRRPPRRRGSRGRSAPAERRGNAPGPASASPDGRSDGRPVDERRDGGPDSGRDPGRDSGRDSGNGRRRGPRPERTEAAAPSLPTEVLADVERRIGELGPHDAARLTRRFRGARRSGDGTAQQAVADAVAAAEHRLERRRAAVPRIAYPPALPVSARREDIAAAIRDHQVVIIAGETGSGKTTQLPKICLELGRGVTGTIGHTQPRRLAARTVAARIAEELGTELGDVVGWKVRFTDQVGDRTMVKLMTDGILLAELAGDRDLLQYDTLIIDEAHERSLNIDFILGYLTRLLPRRPDLKVIITSATIDPERFSRHFGAAGNPAPIVEVSGRSYPVEVRYRPVVDPDDPDADPDREEIDAIGDAVTELQREGPGDILVFLPGEREIRDTADALTRRSYRNTEILPLYARLTTAEQQRVFAPHPGNRIVLATNVAETSLTVPGIKYVIDTGTARISRYSRRLKVQRLPIEKVSQASANQRAGRCGRTSDGICIRLYAEDDFDARPEFTDPEILRTNLASVVLQMIALDLGEISEFPFVEPPDKRDVADGLALLHELGAVDHGALTAVGQALARLPVDPRLGRMLVEANRTGCLTEVLVIAAALSVQDPRERPTEQRQAADEQHNRFRVEGSDFLAFVSLWQYLAEQREALSGNRFRRTLREEFLHYLRIREWWDLHGQLRQAARSAGMTANDSPADADRIHQALLSGLLSQVGLLEETDKRKDPKERTRRDRPGARDYLGARNARFAIWPGSALAKKPPRWVMAAELVETSRLWARTVARIKPEWIEPLAGHLVKRTYSEPHWSRKRASAVATERVTLHGIPVIADRTVEFGRIDPEVSRDLFLRHALVEGDWETRHRFFHANRELLDDAEELEHRARRRDLVVDEDTLFDFYDRRVPASVVSGRHFDSWWKKESKRNPDLLDFTVEMLETEAARGVDRSAYPDHVAAGGLTLPLSYAFEPGHHTDGVTVDVPVAALHQVDPTPFTWQVPGLREELVTALIKTLPKTLRRNFSPAPDHARAVLARVRAGDEPLLDALERELGRMRNVRIGRDDWELDRLPEHLVVTFRVVDEKGRELTRGTDLEALREQLAPQVRQEIAAAGRDVERSGLTTWDLGDLPHELPIRRGTHVVTGFPGLVDRGSSVDVRVFATAAERDAAHRRGVRRLLLLATPSPAKQVQRGLDNKAKLTLSRNPHGSVDALLEDCLTCAADHLIARAGGPCWDTAGFERLRGVFAQHLGGTTMQVLQAVRAVLDRWHPVQAALAELRSPTTREGVADIRAQLDGLVGPGFATAAGANRLADVARYLQAVGIRIDKLRTDPARDAEWTAQVHVVADEYADEIAGLPAGVDPPAGLVEVRWMIEELRVSLYAHPMKTRYPVSIKRIQKALDEL